MTPDIRPPARRSPLLRQLLGCRRGATAIEYALIGAILATVILSAMTNLGADLQAAFDRIVATLGTAFS